MRCCIGVGSVGAGKRTRAALCISMANMRLSAGAPAGQLFGGQASPPPPSLKGHSDYHRKKIWRR